MKKKYYFCWKNIKKISLKQRTCLLGELVFWIVMAVLFAQYLFVPIQNSNNPYSIEIKQISIDPSLSKVGGKTLEIISTDGTHYYCHYDVFFFPGTGYRHFKDKIETDLISGNVKHVTIKESNDQTWQGFKNRGIRISELTTENKVYFDPTIDRLTIIQGKFASGFLFVGSSFFLFIHLVIIQHSYKIIKRKKIDKEDRKKTEDN